MATMVRMAQVAKHLGIPSQELRKLLAEVDFGVRPADREVPEALAAGIVRFASRRLNIKCPPLILQELEVEEETSEELEKSETGPEETPATASAQDAPEKSKGGPEKIQKEDAEKKKTELPSKKPTILRKIEISPEAAAEAKEKMKVDEDEKRRLKEEKEQEAIERKLLQSKKQEQIFKKKEGVVELPESLPVKEFAEKIGIPTSQIITALIRNGVMATINTTMDYETSSIIAAEFDIEVKKTQQEASSESLFARNLKELLQDEPENLKERPPVVVVMGHVDHGKTSILDSIRNTKVAAGEAGGITQHIGAYQVKKNKRLITFLDTPGHESFTAMRARGAQTADIAILVVAADEGIKPQTIEAINHAKEAEVPIIVAMNKIDKPNINPEKVKGELNEHGLQAEEWGGQTPVIPVSAYTGKGITDLLEIVLLQADLLELKANPNRPAVGTVIEAHLDPAMGPVATILINTGTLHVKDAFLVGVTGGRVKTMIDDTGAHLKAAPPAGAVQISGLDEVPTPGDVLQVFQNEKIMRAKLEEIQTLSSLEKGSGLGISEIMNQLRQGEMDYLKIVLKADTNGSLEAVKQALGKMQHEEVGIKIIHAAPGAVTETDVMMAAASQGFVAGFNVVVSPRVRRIAEKEGVEIRNYEIIYQMSEEIQKILSGMLKPEEIEVISGSAVVKQVFYTKRKMMIVGCRVEAGKIKLKSKIRILRDGEQIGEGVIAGLQHFEEKVKEIAEGQECGIQFEGPVPVQEGDILECVELQKKIRTL